MTWEDRPLQIAIFSSPENMARLEGIRINNLRMAGLADGQADLTNPVAIVWLSMSVHGNESAGSECSPELAFRLAAQTDPQIQNWLKNTVVILDPSLNPDGYSRYVNWYRGVAHRRPNVDLESREHREPWGTGRSNHYYFDLNRDWAWATQAESQARLAVYHRWLPQVHPDIHEQGIDNPYYFAPAAEPLHDFITPWQRNFQVAIGENHARYFDKNGWTYFTGEVFDLFYPSYGDTYPMYNGAIGMTYEQGGIGCGRAVILENGDTLTLRDRILHHLTTSLSTIEVASKNAADLVRNFKEYYANSQNKPQGKYLSYIIRATNQQNKVNDFCRLLDRHHIVYGRAGRVHTGVRGYDYRSNSEITAQIGSDDLVISAYQPHSVMLQVLLDPESHLTDSVTYDITAWSLPHAYGLDMLATTKRLEPEGNRLIFKAKEFLGEARPTAWAFARGSLAEAKFLSALMSEGVQIRYSTKDFLVDGKNFSAGSFVAMRSDNFDLESGFDRIVRAAAVAHNVEITPILSGLMGGKGRDLGSDAYHLIRNPEVAIVYGEDVDDNSFGHTWYCFEHDFEMPVAAIPLEKLSFSLIEGFNTLVFPHGQYGLTDEQLEVLQDWMKNGGRVIAFEGGAKAFAGRDGFDLKIKEVKKNEDEVSYSLQPYSSRDRMGMSEQTPGAVVLSEMDDTHPMGFGMGENYFSLKTSSTAFEPLKNGQNISWVGEKFFSTGFIGSRLKPRLEKTLLAGIQRVGRGDIVYFSDNPLFRAFWYQGKVLFFNSLIF